MKVIFCNLNQEAVRKIAFQLILDLKEVVLSTIDKEGYPASRIVDMMFQEEDELYFLTCNVKPLYYELKRSEKIAITVMTKEFMQIRIQGSCVKVESDVLKKIYLKNPSLAELFPEDGETQNIEIFRIYKGKGELFDLSGQIVKMQRARFSFGGEQVNTAGCKITDACINCGKCAKECPFVAISKKEHFEINSFHCDECGICYKICPVNAINLPTGL